MTDLPAHFLDEDGEYDPSVDELDRDRIIFEVKVGIYDPARTKDRSDEWLHERLAEIDARLESHTPEED